MQGTVRSWGLGGGTSGRARRVSGALAEGRCARPGGARSRPPPHQPWPKVTEPSPGWSSPPWSEVSELVRGHRAEPWPEFAEPWPEFNPPWSEVSELATAEAHGRPTATVPRPGHRSLRPALAGGRRAGSWQDTGVRWRTRPAREMQDTACEIGGRWQDRGHRCVRRQLRLQAAGPRPSMRAAALRLVGIGDKIGGSRNRRCNLWRSFL
jgi:hypothetical protein